MNDPLDEFASFFAKMAVSLNNRRFTDVRVTCGDGKVVSCHRLVLIAASSFLDAVFTKDPSITNVALPPEIDSRTFRLILTYMYSGSVSFVSDENVFQVLVASHFLRLTTVRDACHYHLSQKGVPRESAEQLFRFARIWNDTSLQSTVSRFILKHMNDITMVGNISPSEFKVLLSYFRATSRVEEESMLEKILEWTLPLYPDPLSREQVKLNCINAANTYSFEYLPQNCMEEYFEKMVPIGPLLGGREMIAWTDFRSSDYRQRFVLHMFSRRPQTPLKLSTLAKKDSAWSSRWLKQLPGVEKVHKLRSAVAGERLYWLASRKHAHLNDQNSLTFYISPSIDISSHSLELSSPFPDFHTPESSLHLCSDDKSTIFACTGDSNLLHMYNCELNEWSSKDLGKDLFPRTMVWHDRQLYLLAGASPTSQVNVLGTLDLREGRFRHVSKEVHSYVAQYECCSYRERVYLASFWGCLPEMIIFDPIAMKPTVVLVPVESPTFDSEFRFASFQDELWTIMSNTDGAIRGYIFDPYSQIFKHVLEERTVLPGSQLIDVVVYK